jgi:hypothetical protein
MLWNSFEVNLRNLEIKSTGRQIPAIILILDFQANNLLCFFH